MRSFGNKVWHTVCVCVCSKKLFCWFSKCSTATVLLLLTLHWPIYRNRSQWSSQDSSFRRSRDVRFPFCKLWFPSYCSYLHLSMRYMGKLRLIWTVIEATQLEIVSHTISSSEEHVLWMMFASWMDAKTMWWNDSVQWVERLCTILQMFFM